jgi:segregation and condensation protein B
LEAVGRAEVIGRPITYGTTTAFLHYFGLKNLDDLPAAEELRRIVVQKPEALLTVDPGLATAPPEQLTIQESPDPTAAAEAPNPAIEVLPTAPEPAAVEAEAAPKSRFGRRQPKEEAS